MSKFIFYLIAVFLFISVQGYSEHAERDFLVVENIPDYIKKISQEDEFLDTFHIVNLSMLENRLDLWREHLPSVEPFYAVKTNHDSVLISKLANLGLSFDCASQSEIKQVLDLGVDPSKIIFSHPRKFRSSIQFSKQAGVKLLVFDSIEELDKMYKDHPNAEFLLRIKTNDHFSSSPLSSKFGATLLNARKILDYACSKNISIRGIAFHVGSNCWHWPSYEESLQAASEIFEYAKQNCAMTFDVLDIGGGWPGSNDSVFIELAKNMEASLPLYFDSKVKVIAEPGRYFAAPTTTAVLRVIGKSVDQSKQDPKISYYLSNGIYGLSGKPGIH